MLGERSLGATVEIATDSAAELWIEYERRLIERQELDRHFEAGDLDFTNKFFSTDMDAEELIKLYAVGQRDFSDVGLCSLDLSDINLAGANLNGARLVGTNLSNANLASTNLSYAYLAGANLSNANLSNANLTSAILAGANLENANFRGAVTDGIEDHQAFYRNTIMPNGFVEVGPYWHDG